MMSSPWLSLPFSTFVVSAAFSKVLHIYIHLKSVRFVPFIVYLPSLLVPDFLLICLTRLLLRKDRGWTTFFGQVLGWILSVVTLAASSSQIGFYYKTGTEMQWEAAGNMTSDADGVKVLLSESLSVLVSGVVLLAISWTAKTVLYREIGTFVTACGTGLSGAFNWFVAELGLDQSHDVDYDDYDYDSADCSYRDTDSEYEAESGLSGHTTPQNEKLDLQPVGRASFSIRYAKSKLRRLPPWVFANLAVAFVLITLLIRPSKPYNHLSTTLPISLTGVFHKKPDYCAELSRMHHLQFPFPELLDKSNWEQPDGSYKGWAPGKNNDIIKKYRERIPDWLPTRFKPSGFQRWDRSQRHNVSVADVENKLAVGLEPSDAKPKNPCPGTVVQDDDYNPADDPLRIDNMNQDILNPLRQVLQDNSVEIRHVALILMESIREELFPIQQGSNIHQVIMETHNEDTLEEGNENLSRLTPNAEKITGKLGGFQSQNGSKYGSGIQEWDDKTEPGMGGINVVGAFTPSSVSTKSVVASHCGVWPLPVDFLEEAETQSYQPCLPQILDLFNRNKRRNLDKSDFRNQRWSSAFFQSVTDHYDRQDVMDRKIGLKHIYNKKKIKQDYKKDKSVKEIGYFGYPEYPLMRYMEKEIDKATDAGQRLFFSHFTSSTHHPWETPKDWNSTKYMGSRSRRRHRDLDKYLDTIRYHDAWLGKILQMFDDKGISNETLVVFVGDHGQAFKEDNRVTGTYENGHVSNFRVPITFRHPKIPRVQYNANATSLSILPTVLDLLINTGSLDKNDTRAAEDLVRDYEGQSLIRPYRTHHNGRRAWNFGVVNSGGGLLSVTSADSPWRMVMPLEKSITYSFSNLETDPQEVDVLDAWSLDTLMKDVEEKYGAEAARWLDEAERVATWWALERKRLWKYAPKEKDTK